MREKKRNGLSRALRIFYGVGDCGYTLTTNVESYFFSFFLTNMAQYSMATISVITTVTSVVCAILVGVAGGIINSSKPMRWGRYRSWLVVIPWLIPLIYPFQFVKIGDGVVSGLIIMAAAIISHTLWQFPYVASISMISVAGKTQEERAQLSSTRAMWNSFSKVIFSLVGVPLAGVFASILGTKNQYAGVAFCLGLAMVIGYYIHFRMFEGYEEKEDTLQNQKAPANEKTSLKDLAVSLIQNPSLVALLIACIAPYVYVFVTSGIAIYYFDYVVEHSEMLSPYIMVSSFVSILGSYLCKKLVKAITARRTFLLALVFMAACSGIAFLRYEHMYEVIVFMSLVQLGFGVVIASQPMLYSDVIIYNQWKTGKNAAGWITGLQMVPLNVGIVSRGLIISACLAVASFDPNMVMDVIPTELKTGICVAFMVIPGAVLLVGALIFAFGFRLKKGMVEQYQAEINARQ